MTNAKPTELGNVDFINNSTFKVSDSKAVAQQTHFYCESGKNERNKVECFLSENSSKYPLWVSKNTEKSTISCNFMVV
jgi:hypothetical protein